MRNLLKILPMTGEMYYSKIFQSKRFIWVLMAENDLSLSQAVKFEEILCLQKS